MNKLELIARKLDKEKEALVAEVTTQEVEDLLAVAEAAQEYRNAMILESSKEEPSLKTIIRRTEAKKSLDTALAPLLGESDE